MFVLVESKFKQPVTSVLYNTVFSLENLIAQLLLQLQELLILFCCVLLAHKSILSFLNAPIFGTIL